MYAPTRNSLTSTKKLVIEWISLSIQESGYSTVLSYNLVWDAGSNGDSLINLIGDETDTLVKRF